MGLEVTKLEEEVLSLELGRFKDWESEMGIPLIVELLEVASMLMNSIL